MKQIYLFCFLLNSILSNKQLLVISEIDDISLESSLSFKTYGAIIPHPKKREKGGEDALLSSKYLLAVADGVGGWANKGIDPSDYSRTLVDNSWLYFKTTPEYYAQNPEKLVIDSALTNPNLGSSTYVVCTIQNEKLKAANVGDSGFLIMRPILTEVARNGGRSFIYDFVLVSKPQQKGYNFPAQLGPEGDDPNQVTKLFDFDVRFGDIILVYSDGVSDNLFLEQIQYIVNLYVEEVKQSAGIQLREFVPALDMKVLNQRLTDRAFEDSHDKNRVSPFGFNSLGFGLIFEGGKKDDISLISAIVVEN